MNTVPQPDIRPYQLLTGEWVYKLHEKYVYRWTSPKARIKKCITVPKGILIDGASVPRILWSATGLTPDGPYRPGVVLHDFGCRHKGWLPLGSYKELKSGVWVDRSHIRWTRKEVDNELFNDVNRRVGMSPFKRRIAYAGVWLASLLCDW